MGKADDPAAILDTQLRVRGALGLRICDASVYPAIRLGPSSPLQKSWRRSSRRNILLTSLFDIFTPRESFTCRVFIASVNVSHCVCARMARQASSFGAPSTAYCPHTILGSFKSSIPIGEWRHKVIPTRDPRVKYPPLTNPLTDWHTLVVSEGNPLPMVYLWKVEVRINAVGDLYLVARTVC